MTQNQSVTAAFAQIPAQIVLAPTSLPYTTLQGQSPAAQTFTITNTGSASLHWTASDNATWLGVSPSSGTLASGASATVTATVSSAALGAGSYNGTITVSDPAASNSPQTVAVTLAVAVPQLTLTVAGQGAGAGTVSGPGISCSIQGASATGDCTGTYDTGAQVTLTADPASGSTFGAWDGACTGSGTCQVTMTQDRSVSAEFFLVPEIAVTPASLSVTTMVGSSPSTESFDITHDGAVALAWSASDDVPWLELSPSSGSVAPGTPTTVTVDVDSYGLSPGVYYGEITVQSAGASNSPQTVDVTLTVTPEGGFAPVLSGLSVQLLALNDSTSCNPQSPPGSVFRFTMNYTDQDGDVDATAVLLTEYEYLPSGSGSGSFTQPPESGLTITGDGFSGQVRSLTCIAFAFTTGTQQTFTLYDANGNESNSVSITLDKPDGANGAGLPSASGATTGIGIRDEGRTSQAGPGAPRITASNRYGEPDAPAQPTPEGPPWPSSPDTDASSQRKPPSEKRVP
jgi:hypothetical protein